ncbi:MAG: peptide chain release factor N(5)-glutamine methyltransferase [Synechocystis sp.]|nr:peptide chain release factor N(5)-glutamine methyltransferase [Synechocystis sp.]
MHLSHRVSGAEFADWFAQAQQMAISQRSAARCAAGMDRGELMWLLQAWTDLDRLTLQLGDYKNREMIKLVKPWEEIKAGWQRRITDRYPVQYLVGQVSWRNFLLKVTPAVLIPRPETELMIDILQSQGYGPQTAGHWVDLGTGSGAIALGLADLFPQAIIHAVDQSQDALAIATENAQLNHLGDRIKFYQGHWWEPLNSLQGQIAGMVSNPPYISATELARLQPEVIRYEPLDALAGGEDGLDSVRELIRRSPHYLQKGGFWLVELMAGQASTVTTLLAQQGNYQNIKIHPDLAGIDRFVSAQIVQ